MTSGIQVPQRLQLNHGVQAWAQKDGFYRRMFITPNCVLYLPFYHLKAASFKSIDRYQHTTTVIGATWGTQGRTLDGLDDYIKIPHHAAIALTSIFSIYLWIKIIALPANRPLFGKRNNAGNYGYQAWLNSADLSATIYSNAGSISSLPDIVTIGGWRLIGFVNDNSAFSFTRDGELFGAGIFPAGTDSGDGLLIGGHGYDAPNSSINAIYGEYFTFNHASSLIESRRIYNSTRWRYV